MKGYCKRAEINLILELVRNWIDLLANKDFEQAADYLTPVPNGKVTYNAEKIKQALGHYSRRYREAPEQNKDRFLPSVTPINGMDMSGENMIIYTRTDVGMAIIDYDVPIDQSWSDLTAKFILTAVAQGFGLGLVDLHVL